MKPTMAAPIRALQEMTVPELREQYREVFRGGTRSRNNRYAWKQVARGILANDEGSHAWMPGMW